MQQNNNSTKGMFDSNNANLNLIISIGNFLASISSLFDNWGLSVIFFANFILFFTDYLKNRNHKEQKS
ncbi:hypothetical protein DY120_01900 [Apilactobacillus micheneri]|uniref:Uncharacterized protein n=1 Tax=Apilactobacillus micheneri TaxID=1899430 RepID=A0ABY2Z432_9LACO|nr:hypothetical protein [Apilactobacillus micheneri]TPR26472.1 hypothetical protein DY114_01900 [Apilactobacillus micheneri]TPR27226.1 hypothetical protein DY111_01900 [Apilactobacillus micheneri]TPR27473.1 hypothetical protein DY113_06850 [Apilactobacillus micheneri]TPR31989.1 hypothetical protein DY117_01900 [Apilactobacillus micheneri]TPR32393.1 hypothetical protein DY120_01900 [Apilactobacillus micheneri]